jgi:exodeoxyribonuclease V alpha subunit
MVSPMTTKLTIPANLFDAERPPHEHQSTAVQLAADNRVLVVTGGPGVGKTFTVNAILQMFQANGLHVELCAPTGKAAMRMKEQTGQQAMTLHRLLGWTPDGWTFNADAPTKFDMDGNQISGPLPCDAVILDEASMVDVQLFSGLLQALKPTQRLVIVGDVDQLPSIGPGRVLFDLIESGVVPSVRLTHIFRQASESRIPYVARDINEGKSLDVTVLNAKGGESDVAFAEQSDELTLQAAIVEAVASHVPARRGIPSDQIQVLCPQHGKAVGDETLNPLLQARLNPNYSDNPYAGVKVGRGYRLFVGDRVLHANRNNYNLGEGVANGETGRVLEANWKGVECPAGTQTSGKGKPVVVVDFGDRKVGYNKNEAEDLELAYAMTVHKSQGSQFPCVVVPVHSCNSFMLTRPLLYTAVTRAEKFLVMLGEQKMLGKAANNTRGVERRTTLQPCLQAAPCAKDLNS